MGEKVGIDVTIYLNLVFKVATAANESYTLFPLPLLLCTLATVMSLPALSTLISSNLKHWPATLTQNFIN